MTDSELDWEPGTVFLRITPKKDERPFVSEHRCWNRTRFIAIRSEEYRKEGGKVEVITEAQYLKEKKR